MTKITVLLKPSESTALRKLAKIELRTHDDQARFLLRDALAQRGLLPKSSTETEEPNLEAKIEDFSPAVRNLSSGRENS